jgi:hypothetical protein
MACRISELVLKCRDPEVLARFWCEVLDFIEDRPGNPRLQPWGGMGAYVRRWFST